MTLFAEYQPEKHGQPDESVLLRQAKLGDAPGLAQLRAERESSKLTEALIRFERELANPAQRAVLWVTESEDSIVGYARSAYIKCPTDALPNHQPEGWYLGGVIVAPSHRRRGLGHRLTAVRLAALVSQGVPEVFFMVNATNHASIDLHLTFGFQELTRDFSGRDAHFEGGVGIVFRLDLAPGASPADC